MKDKRMSRLQLLAAEIFGYSYANYREHLGIGNVRFDSLMPNDAETLERALKEEWKLERVAQELKVDCDIAAALLNATRDAIAVVDAENPAESFRHSVRQLAKQAATEGLATDEEIEKFVIQICYRVSDLSYLLKRDGNQLSRYCRHLRREPEMNYYDGYFEETD
ncbi:MAG: hypothetical protein R3C03_20825 [Pirellulaceae bacterium]